MEPYKRHHYVPQWYQHRFFNGDEREQKFFYLDLKPETISLPSGGTYIRRSLLRRGPPKCFFQEDLYTTRFGQWESKDIEEKFFGKIDAKGKRAVEYFSKFQHPSVDPQAFDDILPYISLQKLRTPKGLSYLASLTGDTNPNTILLNMQKLQNLHNAVWTECVWSIVDASQSATKFILSDHPVSVYNQACDPWSEWCSDCDDPHILMNGTQTIFPLNIKKALILTNLSWVRNPDGKPLEKRPHPVLFRDSIFNFQSILTGHMLTENEVVAINYVTKKRADRYIAAPKKEWLFPENNLSFRHWREIGSSYVLMPDPRSVEFSDATFIGYGGGRVESFDEYGRRPRQDDYQDRARFDREWDTFHHFQGKYARIFGPKRRGIGFELGGRDRSEDSPDFHAYHLSLEEKHKPKKRGT